FSHSCLSQVECPSGFLSRASSLPVPCSSNLWRPAPFLQAGGFLGVSWRRASVASFLGNTASFFVGVLASGAPWIDRPVVPSSRRLGPLVPWSLGLLVLATVHFPYRLSKFRSHFTHLSSEVLLTEDDHPSHFNWHPACYQKADRGHQVAGWMRLREFSRSR